MMKLYSVFEKPFFFAFLATWRSGTFPRKLVNN